MENIDIISKIKEQAYENVNKKIEEERKETERKITEELEIVEECIDLINKKLIFKKDEKGHKKYILATPEIFFEDYNKEVKYNKGIQFNYEKLYYQPYFKVNGEYYYDVRYIIGLYERDFRNLHERINRLYDNLRDLEEKRKEMLNQQPVIKELLKQYTESHKNVHDE